MSHFMDRYSPFVGSGTASASNEIPRLLDTLDALQCKLVSDLHLLEEVLTPVMTGQRPSKQDDRPPATTAVGAQIQTAINHTENMLEHVAIMLERLEL